MKIEKVKGLVLYLILVTLLMSCQSGNDLGVQLMSGDGQDLGTFTKGEKIEIPGVLTNPTDSTRLLYAINLSPLRQLTEPVVGNSDSQDFNIEILDTDVFLIDGQNELVIMRLDGNQQAEHSMSFRVE